MCHLVIPRIAAGSRRLRAPLVALPLHYRYTVTSASHAPVACIPACARRMHPPHARPPRARYTPC
ncbi:hypothetical protein AQ730_21685 [Burkholderia pseudomallei]|uniref:hypothetical protein n=1 Tax=Burkholderia pseudomallei TaxID=28450 RepID=UPI00098139FB|nr:hypothetical protein [Burkholderia pseudomallei]OMR85316.1 hypothetical protein AQ730_21685 [Burkholderia pseudomallei]